MIIKVTRIRVALATAILGVAVAGVSYAAIPAANGTISACKDNKGSLKVIDAEAGQTCNGNQELLTWNQQGPQGAPGLTGYEVVQLDGESAATTDRGAQILCPTGKKALGGGGAVLTEAGIPWPLPTPYVDAPLINGVGWDFRAHWSSPGIAWRVRAYAICASVDS